MALFVLCGVIKGCAILLLAPAEVSGVDIGDAHDSASLRQSRGHLLQKRQWRVRRGNPINVHFSCAAFQIVKEIAVFGFSDVDKARGSRCRLSAIRVYWYSGPATPF